MTKSDLPRNWLGTSQFQRLVWLIKIANKNEISELKTFWLFCNSIHISNDKDFFFSSVDFAWGFEQCFYSCIFSITSAPLPHLCSSSTVVIEQLNEPFTGYLNKEQIGLTEACLLFLACLFSVITSANSLRSDIWVTKPGCVQLIPLMALLLHHCGRVYPAFLIAVCVNNSDDESQKWLECHWDESQKWLECHWDFFGVVFMNIGSGKRLLLQRYIVRKAFFGLWLAGPRMYLQVAIWFVIRSVFPQKAVCTSLSLNTCSCSWKTLWYMQQKHICSPIENQCNWKLVFEGDQAYPMGSLSRGPNSCAGTAEEECTPWGFCFFVFSVAGPA